MTDEQKARLADLLDWMDEQNRIIAARPKYTPLFVGMEFKVDDERPDRRLKRTREAQMIKVERFSCPDEGNASYAGRCWDGHTSDDYGNRYECSECGGKGYILAVSKDAVLHALRDEIAKMIEERIGEIK